MGTQNLVRMTEDRCSSSHVTERRKPAACVAQSTPSLLQVFAADSFAQPFFTTNRKRCGYGKAAFPPPSGVPLELEPGEV